MELFTEKKYILDENRTRGQIEGLKEALNIAASLFKEKEGSSDLYSAFENAILDRIELTCSLFNFERRMVATFG